MKGLLYQVLSVSAIIGYFIPLIILLLKKLWRVLPFRLFSLYWAMTGAISLLVSLPLGDTVVARISVIYNALDMPILLGIFYITTRSVLLKKIIAITGPLYLFAEVAMLVIHGITYVALKYTMGAGLVLILFILLWELARYLRQVEHNQHEKPLLFMYAALLFVFGTYVIIYIFDYFIVSDGSLDSFLVYYIAGIIAVVIFCIGLFIGKRNTALFSGAQQQWPL